MKAAGKTNPIAVKQGHVETALRCYDAQKGIGRQQCLLRFAKAFNLTILNYRRVAWAPYRWAAFAAVKSSCAKRLKSGPIRIKSDLKKQRCLIKQPTKAGIRTRYTNCIRAGSYLMRGVFGWGCTLANYIQDEASVMTCLPMYRGANPACSIACRCNGIANNVRIPASGRRAEFRACIAAGARALRILFTKRFSWMRYLSGRFIRYSTNKRTCGYVRQNPRPQMSVVQMAKPQCARYIRSVTKTSKKP